MIGRRGQKRLGEGGLNGSGEGAAEEHVRKAQSFFQKMGEEVFPIR